MDGKFLGLCLACWVALVSAADLTRQPKATGPEVVEAVVNIIRESCLFADDRRFLRRLAYVESQDGTSPSTFRNGYYGGIWQVCSYHHHQTLQLVITSTSVNIIAFVSLLLLLFLLLLLLLFL